MKHEYRIEFDFGSLYSKSQKDKRHDIHTRKAHRNQIIQNDGMLNNIKHLNHVHQWLCLNQNPKSECQEKNNLVYVFLF